MLRSVSARRASAGLVLAALLALGFPSCGGAAPSRSQAPVFVASFPDDAPGGGAPPATTPPPSASLAPWFDADAYGLERVALFGSFPSDVVLHDRTVFTSDADQIDQEGARIVPIDAAGPMPRASSTYRVVTLAAEDLVDSAGRPASVAAPIGFGAFVNDLLVVSPQLGFALVNAGGSDSSPALSNLVVFDPSEGAVRQVVDLAHVHPADGRVDSEGHALPTTGFRQSGAEALAYVPTGIARGRLFVAMTNLVFGAPSYGSVKYPGTLQVYDVRPLEAAPVRRRPTGSLTTETVLLEGYNPGSIEVLDTDGGARLLVTVCGATGYVGASSALAPRTGAHVQVFEGATGLYLGRFDLGLVGLAAARPALGRDRVGHRVGFFPSAVTGEVYLLRLDGLYDEVVDPLRLAVLRGRKNGIPIASGAAGLPGGNVTAVGIVAGGRALLVAGFGDLFALPAPRPGRLYLVALPDDVVSGSGFGANFVPGWSLLETLPGRTLGALVLGEVGAGRPDAYVAVSGSIDSTTFAGEGAASVGALWLRGAFAAD